LVLFEADARAAQMIIDVEANMLKGKS